VENRPTFAVENQEQLLRQRLLRVPIFNRLSSKQMQLLLKVSRSAAIGPGEALWMEGDPCQGLFVLLKGSRSAGQNWRRRSKRRRSNSTT